MKLLIEGFTAGAATKIRNHFDKAYKGELIDFLIWAESAAVNADIEYHGDTIKLIKRRCK